MRYEVLRKPWGQGSPDQKEPDEGTALHGLIINQNEEVLATARIHRVDQHTAQVRFMAVREDVRGQGLGKAVLQFIESLGRKNYPEVNRIILQSRENAVSFYQANGYSQIAKSFLLFGEIQHFLMEKQLDKK